MKKIIIVSCLFVLLSPSLAFAQSDRSGTIEGTFGIGAGFYRMVDTSVQLSMIFDLNIISKTGFTICLTNVIGLQERALFFQNIMIGAGYQYLRDNWSVGGALLFSPMAFDFMLGGTIYGRYFFSCDIGITGMILYRRTVAMWDMSMFDIFAGITIRPF
jgi:hypothetical protein